MSQLKEKVSLFVGLVVATIKGDDVEVKAIKIQKKALAYLDSQIAIKSARIISLQEELDNAVEKQQLARINQGETISGEGETYIANLFAAKDKVEAAKEALEDTQYEIEFLKEERNIVAN